MIHQELPQLPFASDNEMNGVVEPAGGKIDSADEVRRRSRHLNGIVVARQRKQLELPRLPGLKQLDAIGIDLVVAEDDVGNEGQLGDELRGRFDASFVGLGPILKRYGIGGDTAAIGALIGTLFGGGRPARPAAPGALSLPIGLGNGRLSIGPITTGVTLTPLY